MQEEKPHRKREALETESSRSDSPNDEHLETEEKAQVNSRPSSPLLPLHLTLPFPFPATSRLTKKERRNSSSSSRGGPNLSRPVRW